MKTNFIVNVIYFSYTIQAILSPYQLVEDFMELNSKYKDYVKVDTAQTRYNLPVNENCISKISSSIFKSKITKKSYIPSPCDTLIVLVTDFNTYNLDRPQIFISGSTEGSNTLGPTITFELIKFLVEESNNKPQWIKRLLKKVMLVITPNTNAYGLLNKSDLDINNETKDEVNPMEQDFFVKTKENVKDFKKSCLKTTTVRTIDYLFNEFNFLQTIFLKSGSKNNFGVLRTNSIDYFYSISLAKQFYIATGEIDSSTNINDIAKQLNWMSYNAALIALSNLSKFFY